jgi:predicted AAA+ superfamily ATPase
MWINRGISEDIGAAARTRPAVVVTGARQTGKSSLLRRLFPRARYVTFDDPAIADFAAANPDGFLEEFADAEAVVLDEIQYAPHLLRSIKLRIDGERRRNGRWILTGSQRFELMRGVSESLAGRVAVFDLHSLAPSELVAAGLDPAEYPLRGGYPELWAADLALDHSSYFGSYIRTYIERDLRVLLDVSSVRDFERFMRVVAARTAQLVNFSALASEVGISGPTGKAWVEALVATGLVALVEPWHSNHGKRIIKTPKVHVLDTGLLSHLMALRTVSDLRQHPLAGAHWESCVHSVLIRDRELLNGGRIRFYRDKSQREVDFVIERGSELVLVEAKLAERPGGVTGNQREIADLIGSGRRVRHVVAAPWPAARARDLGGYLAWNPVKHRELSRELGP